MSLGIFFAGFSMAVTPGKVGEFLKAYLLRRATGVPVARTAPIIVAERLTDGMAMLALAAAGLVTVRYGWQLLMVMALGAAAGVFVLQRRPLVLGILGRLEQLPLLAGRVHPLRVFYESTYLLLKQGNLLIATGIGVVSWSSECLAFASFSPGLAFPSPGRCSPRPPSSWQPRRSPAPSRCSPAVSARPRRALSDSCSC